MSVEALESDADSGQDMSEFNWDDYLEETGALSVPHHAFKHMDQGLQTGLAPGMKLEVLVRSEGDEAYWVSTIITTCGQLLLLRYEGYQDDRRADFWCDITTADLHPIGWSKQQGRPMKPPEGVREKHQDWEALLEKALSLSESCSAPASLLEGAQRGCNPVDLLSTGLSVELVDNQDAAAAWCAVIEDNVGGRLRLRYSGTEGLPDAQSITWVFYLNPLLHLPGWAKEHGLTFRPPSALLPLRTEEEWEGVRQTISTQTQDSSISEEFYKDRPAITTHCFTEGMKLEAADPAAPFTISPATVAKVFGDQWFLVQMDDLREEEKREGRRAFLCHKDSPGIFPTQWSLKNGVKLSPPPGYQGQDFDWADYLKQCEAEAAPQHCFPPDPSDQCFKESMMLEAVNPLCPENIHVATVTKVKGQHIWIRLEGVKQPVPEIIVHMDSMDIFPVSWCETNGYPLQYPCKPKVEKQKKIAVVQPERQALSKDSSPDALKQPLGSQTEMSQANGKYCCPKIYFNHRCFSGPYLNKGRIAELPQCVGPGNCVLVLKEVLTLLINSAYKPSRVLRELQLDQEGRWQGHGETLKAKYKGKSYRATVEIVRTADRVAEFCRKTCIKLECCPNLFGPRMVLERCSENCSVLTKTKYTYYYGKKKSRRVGRPPGGHSNLEGGVKKRGRRRKRRKQLFVHKKRRSSASMDNTPAGSPQGSGDEEDLDEDDSLSEDTGSELQDELMDDSEYSEKKSQPPTPSPSPPETPRPSRRRRKARSPSYSDDENRPPSPKSPYSEAPQKLCLDSSPLEWSVTDVVRFIRTTDCAPLARIFMDQEIDGQALLLLNLPTVQECMDLKLGPAIKLCHHIERVKLAFYQQFAS
ncbi:scm-like with four MBT domains protein 1 isoform X2 [Astyanax mexicanus]|uniref:scm-like with four MBT domains protein 1 isoform X2 n=1 Tax=Astyanax mexicanus TaxID=7994 RepID=UPI0020CB106F|nr:scm-like with four MBT domains protein 1 isoform X2 [Astyanax mexicanus]